MANTKDDKKPVRASARRDAENSAWIMPETKFKRRPVVRPAHTIDLRSVLVYVPPEQRDRILQSYRMSALEKLFRNEDIMATVDGFLKYGLNICETSRRTFMHRNSLMYRLNKIRDLTGLDIRIFECAQTFKILHILYTLREKEREEERLRLAEEEKMRLAEAERIRLAEEDRLFREEEERRKSIERQERVVNNKK